MHRRAAGIGSAPSTDTAMATLDVQVATVSTTPRYNKIYRLNINPCILLSSFLPLSEHSFICSRLDSADLVKVRAKELALRGLLVHHCWQCTSVDTYALNEVGTIQLLIC